MANRYARALIDVVTKPGSPVTPEKATAEIADFLAALHTSPELRTVLVSPAVPPANKKSIIAGVAGRLGLSRTTQNFLRVVIDHRRLPLLPEMASAFETLLDERMGVVRAEVASGQPVDPDQQTALADRLGELTGKRVRPHFTVDPALLGGVVARIGSTIYDGSVRGQLHALERRLAAE